ncbi:RHS repeat domain-containing protein [Acinetobacter guillouiae]|uniref:Teneurin-like YD-shell domain-containing protein n=1 Tax=Acinetobacter guillouiae NIPH 991 TaxID=1217656 RepID=N8WWC1_ACIGI|nr:RHS repeat-associated core domain-containing protein [Acinetobacter guillouiae]ENV16276.1 hypothetical protein F964_03211 [Acinetobacter guillouiae NIPH 991]
MKTKMKNLIKNNNMQSNKIWLITVQSIVLSLFLVLSQLTLAKDRIQYHVQNFDGSTLKVINEQGVVSQSYQYAPFGQQLQYKKPSNLKNPNAFVGGVQDADDLVYLKQRHYNPVLGRFYQPDPVTYIMKGHGQTNRYQYGWNDTYTFSDPNGRAVQLPLLAFGIWALDNLRSDSLNVNNAPPSGIGDAALLGYSGASLLFEANMLRTGMALSASSLPLYTFLSKPTTVYRTMEQADYLILQTTGRLPGTASGTFISPNLAYAQGTYKGVTVEFQINPQFYDQMLKIATRDTSKAVSSFPQYASLPIHKSGWGMNNILIKSEKFNQQGAGGIISIGLGRGAGLDLFNQNIIRFREVPR